MAAVSTHSCQTSSWRKTVVPSVRAESVQVLARRISHRTFPDISRHEVNNDTNLPEIVRANMAAAVCKKQKQPQ